MDEKKMVRDFYNQDVEHEWERLQKHRAEFEITTKFMDRYIKKGDKVLDVSGGPGRYSLYFAHKGCDVTLVDLSPINVEFALQKAKEQGVCFKALAGDACEVDSLIDGEYDHVFLMGALYHLQEEKDRVKAVNACLKLLKPGRNIYVSFISSVAGMIYLMKNTPELILDESQEQFIDNFIQNDDFTGVGFTSNHFINSKNVLPFMEQFQLEKLHLFSQEGIMAPCENKIMEQSEEVIKKWIDTSYKICEKEELLGYAEHLMYIGTKL